MKLHANEVERVIGKGWLPEQMEVLWPRGNRAVNAAAYSAAITLIFIEHYASTALRVIGDPRTGGDEVFLTSRDTCFDRTVSL